MTNLEALKDHLSKMSVDELIEFFGGDTFENRLCTIIPPEAGSCYGRLPKRCACAECIKNFLLKEYEEEHNNE